MEIGRNTVSMDSAGPLDRSEWRRRLRGRHVKMPKRSVTKFLKGDYNDDDGGGGGGPDDDDEPSQ